MVILTGCGLGADYYTQAVRLARQGDFDRAILLMEKAAMAEPSSAKILYSLGVFYTYNDELDKALATLNKAAGKNTDGNPHADGYTASLLDEISIDTDTEIATDLILKHQKVFAPDEVMSNFYNMADIEYFWRCVNYQRIARQIIKDCKTDEEKAMALFDWTYRNVGIVKEKRVLFALPYDIMLRGYGLCDRSSWVLTTLANQAGFKGSIYMLLDPDTGASPHTVALIYLLDKWVVFDTYYGFVLKMKDGKTLAGLNDIIDNPSLTGMYPPYGNNGFMPFKQGLLGLPLEAEAGLPRIKVIQDVVDEIFPDAPNVYRNMLERLHFTIKTLLGYDYDPDNPFTFPFRDKNRQYIIGSWFYPYMLKPFYAQGLFVKQQKKEDPAVEYYQAARYSFLLGDYRKAVSQFDELLKTSPDAKYSSDMEYFKCLCYFGAKEYKKTVSELERYLQDYPDSKWQAGAMYHLGRSYEALGMYQKAVDIYRKMENEPGIQLRAKEIESRIKKN